MECLNCQSVLTEKYQIKFCNRSCAATYNNTHFPKRIKIIKEYPKCKLCDNPTKRKSGTYCNDCIGKKKHIRGIPVETQTIGECSKRSRSNRYDIIRDHARRQYKEKLSQIKCEFCGYDKHVEMCHKNAISSFSKETLVSKVNSRENIIFLCPNCHWEFDHPN